jgi:hypothetical protein
MGASNRFSRDGEHYNPHMPGMDGMESQTEERRSTRTGALRSDPVASWRSNWKGEDVEG